MRRLGILCLFLLISISSVQAQVKLGDDASLSGRVFSDYYWVASSHNEDLENNNGFWFRRIYLTYNRELGGSFSTRLRLEMGNEGDFVSSSDMFPSVKDAYLKWENDQHEVLAGISSTPTFGLVEDLWGYRSVEKTPLDLHDLGSSRDFGIAARGTLGSENKWGYHAMLGNGQSNGPEVNQGKKVMLSIHHKLTENWIVEAYGDFNSFAEDEYWTTLQGFAGYQTENTSLGLLYARQFRNNPDVIPGHSQDVTLEIASIFARTSFTDQTSGFLRIDRMFDPNPDGEGISYIPMSNEAKPTFIVGGMDFLIESGIHLIPNIEAVMYGESAQGTTPKSDLIPRLTLFFQF